MGINIDDSKLKSLFFYPDQQTKPAERYLITNIYDMENDKYILNADYLKLKADNGTYLDVSTTKTVSLFLEEDSINIDYRLSGSLNLDINTVVANSKTHPEHDNSAIFISIPALSTSVVPAVIPITIRLAGGHDWIKINYIASSQTKYRTCKIYRGQDNQTDEQAEELASYSDIEAPIYVGIKFDQKYDGDDMQTQTTVGYLCTKNLIFPGWDGTKQFLIDRYLWTYGDDGPGLYLDIPESAGPKVIEGSPFSSIGIQIAGIKDYNQSI